MYDLEDFMYNDVNITAYRFVDYTNPMVRNILKEVDKYHPNIARKLLHRNHLIKVRKVSVVLFSFLNQSLQASSAIMFDSVYAFARGLHQFHKSSTPMQTGLTEMNPGPAAQTSTVAMVAAGAIAAPPPPPSVSGKLLPIPLNTFASCSNETPWTNGLSLYNYIDSVSRLNEVVPFDFS